MFKYKKNNDNTLTVYDNIYGKINVPYPYSKIILTKEMMRLNNISQNGFLQYEFNELEKNDRLSHSVGAFYVMSMFLEKLENILSKYNIKISNNDKDLALCSMLLHDIGHGPFSHSLEQITKYSHEKRTTDILLGNTEVGNLLNKLYGRSKVKKIASFIAEINEKQDLENDSFTNLLKSLVSHQLDADRLDYLIRDAFYVSITPPFNVKKIIENIDVILNNDQEYELLIKRKGLSSIENVLIHRYQMYRDVYLSPISVLGDEIFKNLLECYRKNPDLKKLPVDKSFNILAFDPKISNLDDFINMKDSDIKNSFEVLKNNQVDLVLAYLCDFNNLKNYVLIENDISKEEIEENIKEIFKDFDIKETFSIIESETKNKLYNKEESLNIEFGNKVVDLTECTNLIKPQEILKNKYLFFNPEVLRLELKLTREEFKKYESEVNKLMSTLNKKPEEFELKYIVKEDYDVSLEKLMTLFTEHGFKIISITEKENDDKYYDTRDLDIYKMSGSLRIRKETSKNRVRYKGTYKMPLEIGEVYSSRTEIEERLSNPDFDNFVKNMLERNVPLDFSKIIKTPILNSKTRRTDIILEKNGVQVCLSHDNTLYINHILDDKTAVDEMIEIEAIGNLNNRIILNEIHDFMSKEDFEIEINKQSKFERGIQKTSNQHNNNIVRTKIKSTI